MPFFSEFVPFFFFACHWFFTNLNSFVDSISIAFFLIYFCQWSCPCMSWVHSFPLLLSGFSSSSPTSVFFIHIDSLSVTSLIIDSNRHIFPFFFFSFPTFLFSSYYLFPPSISILEKGKSLARVTKKAFENSFFFFFTLLFSLTP